MSGKPIALQTGSPGVLGGARSQCHLRQILVALNGQVLDLPEVFAGQIDKRVDPGSGCLSDNDTQAHLRRQRQALCDSVCAR